MMIWCGFSLLVWKSSFLVWFISKFVSKLLFNHTKSECCKSVFKLFSVVISYFGVVNQLSHKRRIK